MCCMRKCQTSECHVCISIQFLPLRPPPYCTSTHNTQTRAQRSTQRGTGGTTFPLSSTSPSLCPSLFFSLPPPLSLYVSFSYHDVRFDTACPQGDTTEQSKQEQPLRPRLMYETRPRRHHAARGDGGDGGNRGLSEKMGGGGGGRGGAMCGKREIGPFTIAPTHPHKTDTHTQRDKPTHTTRCHASIHTLCTPGTYYTPTHPAYPMHIPAYTTGRSFYKRLTMPHRAHR
jgi:hypothetical protein